METLDTSRLDRLRRIIQKAMAEAAQRTDRIMPPAVRLLFNEDGTLDERLLEQLQADRDETPVLLTE